jgi:uncharacterized protein (TIGR02147 family)
MKPIYSYIDYRQFLDDFFQEKKRTTRHFSNRYFAGKIGTSSPTFFSQVVAGKRNLTGPMIEKFIDALKLSNREAIFFRNLVLFCQSKSSDEKQQYYQYLLSMMGNVDERQVSADQFKYFSIWYHAVIRELVTIHDFKDDYDKIAKAVIPPITPSQAEKSIELLMRLKLMEKKSDGCYSQTSKAITTGVDPMLALARRSFNGEMVSLAQEANKSMDKDERNISGITMGISKACYDVLLVELDAFKKRIITIVNNDRKSSRVYQFNFQIFPLSKDMADCGKPSETSDTQEV